MIPKFFVAGLFMPPPFPGTDTVTKDKLNRIWADVSNLFPYQGIQFAPGFDGAQLIGAHPEEGVTIQPPLLQVRDLVDLAPEQSLDKARTVLKIIARHVGVAQFFNLGIKFVYHVPAPNGDARQFLHSFLLHEPDQLAILAQGGSLWAGGKYVIEHPDLTHTVVVEPFQADNRYVFIDLDTQWPGPFEPDQVQERGTEALRFLQQGVRAFIERASGG